MLLHEIISMNDETLNGGQQNSILIETLLKYKKSLLTYYAAQFPRNCEVMLMVTSVFNAAQYGVLVPSTDFSEAVQNWVNSMDFENDEERESEFELICFQSVPF